jgi:tryptophan synthase alpha chain
VTGVRDQVASNIPEAVAAIRKHTGLPVVVGFGISTRAQVGEVARHADGVVVGSALVNVIKAGLADRKATPARLGMVAADLVAGTRRV